jgi:serine/threonine protein kinase
VISRINSHVSYRPEGVIHEKIRVLVEGCLRKNPEERFTLDDLLDHSAFDFCRQRYASLLDFLNDKNPKKIHGFC